VQDHSCIQRQVNVESLFRGRSHRDKPFTHGGEGDSFSMSIIGRATGMPCGQTITYAAVAGRIGRHTAVRAVGLANGGQSHRNPGSLSSGQWRGRSAHRLR
jgi:O6-methylguanine-DNA--protein-cysteine methyltransferase